MLAEPLNFSDAQRETLTSKADEYEREKQERTSKIQAEYDAKLLAHLTPLQRKLYESQVGKPFEYAPVSREAQSFDRIREMKQRYAARATP